MKKVVSIMIKNRYAKETHLRKIGLSKRDVRVGACILTGERRLFLKPHIKEKDIVVAMTDERVIAYTCK